jgi:hypothetical protein
MIPENRRKVLSFDYSTSGAECPSKEVPLHIAAKRELNAFDVRTFI